MRIIIWKDGYLSKSSDALLQGRTKQNFQYKAKAPEHDTIVKRGFRVDHEKDLMFLCA